MLPVKKRSTLKLTQSLLIGRDSMFFILAPEYEWLIHKEREEHTERGRDRVYVCVRERVGEKHTERGRENEIERSRQTERQTDRQSVR